MDFDEEVPFHERSSCEWYGHSYAIVDSHGDEETYQCRDCGHEYTY